MELHDRTLKVRIKREKGNCGDIGVGSGVG